MGLPIIGAAGGALLGAVNNNQKRAEYNRQKELSAQTALYSPWTHLNAMEYMPKSKPNSMGDMFSGAIGGLQMGSKGGMLADAFGGGDAPQMGGSGGGSPWGAMGGYDYNQAPKQFFGM